METHVGKTRIAILGNGPAALGAAWEITESPDWQDRFEIDFYSIGWRLGGKCASGRSPEDGWRNKEHGLHILGGFYHNCFDQLHHVFVEWQSMPECLPIPYDQAFIPHDSFTLMQRDPGDWRQVRVNFPTNGKIPGIDPEEVRPGPVVRLLLDWMAAVLRRVALGQPAMEWMEEADNVPVSLAKNSETEELLMARVHQLEAAAMAWDADETKADTIHGASDEVVAAVDNMQQLMRQLEIQSLASIRGADWWGLLSLAGAICRGIVADRIFSRGYDVINDIECNAWLAKHGASPAALRASLFQAGYHYAFGYTNGDPARPDIAAGAGLRGYLRMIFAVHGSVFYHMDGGMGETYVLPYYDTLRRRGVRFHFFHKVTQLEPDESGEQLGRIVMQVQAKMAAGTDYDPVLEYSPRDRANRRCWPEEPLFDQLENGDELKQAGLDLEAWHGSDPPGSEVKTLEAGRDFDQCILAIPSGMLRIIAAPLAEVSGAWLTMLDGATTTPTIAAQFWRKEPVDAFGGLSGDGLATANEFPHDTWADMSFLLGSEGEAVAGQDNVLSLSYLCGPYPALPGTPPAGTVQAKNATRTWLDAQTSRMFPGIADNGKYDRSGEVSFYARINDDPAKLYVTSAAGSIEKRLRCDESGFANLFLAGDWTRHNFDMGAVEAAILSAKLCARAICGYPRIIYGESDLPDD